MDIRTQERDAAPRLSSDEVSLAQILYALRSRRWPLIAIALTTVLLASAALVVLPNTYAASVLLSPTPDSLGSGGLGMLGSSVSRLGSIASLAGFDMPTDTRQAESIAMLESRVLTEEYIRNNGLLPVLFPKKWDASRGRWKVTSPQETPTLWQGYQMFKRIRTVKTDPKTGLVTLTIKWQSPVLAAKWANDLVKLTNDYLRSKAIAESERNIAYLNDEASKTNVVESRQAISALLESEINKVMLARGSEEYALKVLDPAAPPERPTATARLLVVVAAIGILFASLLWALFRAG